MSDWISVEERLPEESPYAILAGRAESTGVPMVTEARFIGGEFLCLTFGAIKDVTHWMPLPSPPTDSEEK